ncbi:MAG TPA: nicotinamide-nucleotide amidohydrolase family protein [Steroidobacteraceae bacterium]|nr:nicotinamide-nucleotide amidohydrolase family protein [Steroidobacteraceae bacterium]
MASDGELSELARQVGHGLKAAGWRLALAESCTGGWVGKLVTDVAGSSAWFERGLITYSNDAKQQLLGVTAAALSRSGAVSAEVAEAMAQGALALSAANLALAVTGIAGPDGGSADKPVGLVWFALAVKHGAAETLSRQFDGDRDAVRRQAVQTGLNLILAATRTAIGSS